MKHGRRSIRSYIRALRGVVIRYSRNQLYAGTTYCVNGDSAVIYPVPAGVPRSRYLFHEYLHVALRRLANTPVGRRRKTEEEFVQDIERLVFQGNLKNQK